jgi:phage anti-repressor protein
MIQIHESKLGQSVYMTELYDYLQMEKSHYVHFIKRNIVENPYADSENDYSLLMASNAKIGQRGRFRKEYEIHIDFAKKLCMVSKSLVGEQIRNELVQLTKQVETGNMFSKEQINFMLELVPVMGLFSIQDMAQKRHYNYHDNPFDWWDYRAKVLGYGTAQLRIEVEKLNHKYKSQRQALMHIDKYELIRVGVIDLFVALGKSVEYASNVADICKNMAQQMKVALWDDSEKKNSIPFKVNYNERVKQLIKENKKLSI